MSINHNNDYGCGCNLQQFNCSTLKVGDICLDNEGREWEFLKCFPESQFGKPYLFCNPKGEINTTTRWGRKNVREHSIDNNPYDIVKKKIRIVRVEGWVNYYPLFKNTNSNVWGSIKASAEEAIKNAGLNAIQVKLSGEYHEC